MTQYFQLRVREGTFRHLTSEEVRTKVQSLMAINFVTLDVDYDGTEPDKPVIETRTIEKRVEVFVCTFKGCHYDTESRPALNAHLRKHKLEIKVPVTR